MQCTQFSRLFQRCCLLTAMMAIAGLVGCGGAVETPAEFQAGAGENPLDGGVIMDDGNSFRFDLGMEGDSVGTVDITTPEGDELVAFRDTTGPGGEAIPSQISTARGNEFEYDDVTGVARVTANLAGTPTTFEFPVDNPFANARAASQTVGTGDCPAIRDSVDEFCEFFLTNAAATKDELIEIATELALDNVDPSLAPFVPGVVAEVINDFYDTLQIFCDAWSEMRNGSESIAAVDPCNI